MRTTTLANRRQTQAVLGSLPDEPRVSEQRQLAGRMLTSVAARAGHFPRSSFKSAAQAAPVLKRIVLPADLPLDARCAKICADGTNLAR